MMIKAKCFHKNWISRKSKEIKTDPNLIEKTIYAFELLNSLVKGDINFVFKGGTSLMLLIPDFRRLSIDLDIVTEDEKKLTATFNNITEEGTFKRWEEDERDTNKEIPKRHFKFYYNSPTSRQELYVLLDVIIMKQLFLRILKLPISHQSFEVEEKIEVSIPTINGLAADKLTAFAPKTIGILYGKDKSMEIIKQLFDLGILFEHISDLSEMYKSYKNITGWESSYRGLNEPIEEYLNDSIDTSFLICQLDFKGSVENDSTKELREGIRRIRSHVFGGDYSLLKAKEDASKVALLASLIKEKRLDLNMGKLKEDKNKLEKIKDINLTKDYNILNKLKRISSESFYLWAVALKVVKTR